MACEFDLVVLGDCNPDLVLSDPDLEPAFGQAERLVSGSELTIGGSGAIMACAAARLGLRTAIISVVGDDLFGQFMLRELAERGVDTSGVLVDARLSTGLTVILARRDDRAILTYKGSIAALSAELVEDHWITGARHVHVSSFFLQSALAAGLGSLLALARRAGTSTSVDPNWDPSGGWDGGLRELIPQMDMLLPNAAEACRLAGCDDPARAARELASAGALVAVKLGADGAIAARAGHELVHAVVPAGVAAVDAVGAGDAFDAGLVAGLLRGASIEQALSLACACGTLSTRAAGGTAAQPTLAEAWTLVGVTSAETFNG